MTTVIGGVTQEGFPGIDYICAPKGSWLENRTRAYARNCIRIINEKRAVLVEIHNRPVLFNLIAPNVGSKLALHLHNDPQEMDNSRTPTEREKLAERCSAIYCVSNYVKNRFVEGLSAESAAKAHVVYNGLALPGPAQSKENLIVYAGRMTEDKGALLLVQALCLALPQLPNWRAVLIGSSKHLAAQQPTAHEKTILQAMQPVANQLKMLGFLSHEETLAWFDRAAIAVVPSLWQEPFGRTALEAMAHSCALISSGRGGLREVTGDVAITPGEFNVQSLAEAITMLARTPSMRTTRQLKGRIRSSAFAIEKCTQVLDTIRNGILIEPSYVA
jgi:glycosyltransferase involved in cell wall biosynthesis